MYNILIKLIIGAALIELGLTATKIGDCSSRGCWSQLQKASRQVLKVDWKPISVFPEEARRLR